MKAAFKLTPIIVFLFSTNAHTANERPIAWVFRTRGPFVASPAIANVMIYIGSMDSTFYAIDAKTGRERWKFQYGHEITSTAVLFNGHCYFESGNILYALKRL